MFLDDQAKSGWFLFYWDLIATVDDLRTLAQFQGSEMSLGFFLDFVDAYMESRGIYFSMKINIYLYRSRLMTGNTIFSMSQW